MMFILLLTVWAIISSCSGDISYKDIQLSDKSCFPLDTCKTKKTTNCKCDNQCVIYGDCCPDFDIDGTIRGSKSEFLCQKKIKGSSHGIYVKSVCSRSSVASWIRSNCEGITLVSDIELKVPVFSLDSSISYKNQYCAMCNNDSKNLTFWNVEVSCSRYISKHELKDRLTYNNRSDDWGFWHYSLGRTTWIPCDVSPQISSTIKNYRECINSISECHPEWHNDTVRHMCGMYESRLASHDGKIYKNFHCALCNNVTVDDLKCQPNHQEGVIFDESARRPHSDMGNSDKSSIKGFINIHGKPIRPVSSVTVNFRDLFDLSILMGNKIGNSDTTKCPEGYVYDEVMRRCSKVYCIGNRVIKNGKCVVA